MYKVQRAIGSIGEQEGFHAEVATTHVGFYDFLLIPGIIIRPIGFHVGVTVSAEEIDTGYFIVEILIVIIDVLHLECPLFHRLFFLFCEAALCFPQLLALSYSSQSPLNWTLLWFRSVFCKKSQKTEKSEQKMLLFGQKLQQKEPKFQSHQSKLYFFPAKLQIVVLSCILFRLSFTKCAIMSLFA